ncbi:nucleotidyltransferase family protein [Spirosoma sp. KUDC1026]|uniref:nucleotidyltransferase family protein n=1 Tax=Spirosoma sp. KUDC1026 TaxID=2745947 RepID=UPI00159BE6C8|nr:nucleotidyltransferase domain-containing protein [Spirosoma sp. KUDC1026]QKZ13693.1 nucleotidyltransferase domain-containing protein [Spirosoma sp. KUDC1026]
MAVTDFGSFEKYLREQRIFDQFGFSQIGVFGSFVRGESFRDIDLLIDEPISYQQLIALRDRLQNDLPYPVDVMLRDYAEPIILSRALSDVRYATRA